MAGQLKTRTIVVVGAKAAGKTSVTLRLIDEPVDFTSYKPTIDDCYNITWKLQDGQCLRIQFVDSAPWNEFPAMQSLFVRMSHLVLVVYDVSASNWRKSLESIISEVKSIKADADILIVGNKCDKLRKGDRFTPQLLHDISEGACLGHVYVSALSQQGIKGLKQLILYTKSQLTEGHYTERLMPKRKKLKKKMHGMAITQLFKRKPAAISPATANTSKPAPISPATADTSKLRENNNLHHDHSNPSVSAINGLNRDFEKLFQFTSSGAKCRYSLDSHVAVENPQSTYRRMSLLETESDGRSQSYNDEFVLRHSIEMERSSNSASDHSLSSNESPDTQIRGVIASEESERRKSMDFSRLELSNERQFHKVLCRQKSISCGNDIQFSEMLGKLCNSEQSSTELIQPSRSRSPSPATHRTNRFYITTLSAENNELREKYAQNILAPEGEESLLYDQRKHSLPHSFLQDKKSQVDDYNGNGYGKDTGGEVIGRIHNNQRKKYSKHFTKQHYSSEDILTSRRLQFIRQ